MHFKVYAPDKIEYAINRYAFETQRHFGILDARLAKQKYMLGDTYTVPPCVRDGGVNGSVLGKA